MVKIKTKKKFTRKELIKHLLNYEDVEVEVGNCEFYYDENGKETTIEPVITGNFDFDFNLKENCLEMLVEEEVTMKTYLPRVCEIYKSDGGLEMLSSVFENECLNGLLDSNSLTFHMINPDGTLTFLWTREGGMVE